MIHHDLDRAINIIIDERFAGIENDISFLVEKINTLEDKNSKLKLSIKTLRVKIRNFIYSEKQKNKV